MISPGSNVHFVGIGGIGMSAIAKILLEMGEWKVQGSDLSASPLIEHLARLGAKTFLGHDKAHIEGADCVVISSAIPEDNPELLEARRKNLKVYRRGELLGFLMNQKRGIAIAGTHGKTTTSAMVSWLLYDRELHPTAIIGGSVPQLGANSTLGNGPYLVAEADESDASFLELNPKIAIVTSIDSDVNLSSPAFASCEFDLDKTMGRVENMFLSFMQESGKNGHLVLCADHERLMEVARANDLKSLTYGLSKEAMLRAENSRFEGFDSVSEVYLGEKRLGELRLQVPGRHNIQNALAAVAVGLRLELEPQEIFESLALFKGVHRRFEVLGCRSGVTVVDDYAHNPSKIRAALHAARVCGGQRVVAVFQPHRYTRTKFLLNEFGEAFVEADILLVTDVYSAGEEPLPGASAKDVLQKIQDFGLPKQIEFTPEKEDVLERLGSLCCEGDVVVTLGAGSVGSWGKEYLSLV